MQPFWKENFYPEQTSTLNKLLPWTNFYPEQTSTLNKLLPWTNFYPEQTEHPNYKKITRSTSKTKKSARLLQTFQPPNCHRTDFPTNKLRKHGWTISRNNLWTWKNWKNIMQLHNNAWIVDKRYLGSILFASTISTEKNKNTKNFH